MDPCAKSLLDGIIDYAGLFPPAQLPMDEAFTRFVEHRSTDDGWMLARFVCPAGRLDELEPLIAGDRLRAIREFESESTSPQFPPGAPSAVHKCISHERQHFRQGNVRTRIITKDVFSSASLG